MAFDSSTFCSHPAGASYIKTAATISGDTLIIGCPRAFGADAVSGGVTLSAANQRMAFWYGAAINNAADGTNDGPSDLAEQFMGYSAEATRIVRR